MKAVVMTLTGLKEHSNPHLRLVIMLVLLLSSLCSMKTVADFFFADYLGDKTPTGKLSSVSMLVHFK